MYLNRYETVLLFYITLKTRYIKTDTMESEQQKREDSVNTIIRYWRKYWWDVEANQPVECKYCGSEEENAKKSSPFCDNGKCVKLYCRDREDRSYRRRK